MFVDEENQATVKLGSSSDKSLTLGRLCIAGVPAGESGTVGLESTRSFYGCVRNIAVDGV